MSRETVERPQRLFLRASVVGGLDAGDSLEPLTEPLSQVFALRHSFASSHFMVNDTEYEVEEFV